MTSASILCATLSPSHKVDLSPPDSVGDGTTSGWVESQQKDQLSDQAMALTASRLAGSYSNGTARALCARNCTSDSISGGVLMLSNETFSRWPPSSSTIS